MTGRCFESHNWVINWWLLSDKKEGKKQETNFFCWLKLAVLCLAAPSSAVLKPCLGDNVSEK